MTLPVSLADTPALPRIVETAAAGPAAGDGGTEFAETLAGAMGPAAARGAPEKGAGKSEAKPAADGGEAATDAADAAPRDAEAMLADLDQRAVAVEGEALVATAVPGTVLGEASAAAPPDPTEVEGAVQAPDMVAETAGSPGETAVPEGSATGEEAEGKAAEQEEIPLALPLTAMLAAALPPAPATEGAAPPVQASDAAVEAARRAMAATMTVPGLVKAEKAAKGPLEGPELAETAAEGKTEMAEKTEVGAAKGAAVGDARAAAVAMVPVVAEARQGIEVRREALAEITLAVAEGETAPATATASGSTTAGPQAGATGLPPGLGGPVQTGRPGWEAALADRIAAELSADGQEIELDLAPETLGQLKIRLEVVDGLAQVRIVTETAEAARLFQQAEHRLSENLSRAGLSLGGQDTTSRDAQGGSAQGQNGQTQAGPGGQGPGDRGGRPRGLEMHFDRQGGVALSELAGRAGRGLVNLIA